MKILVTGIRGVKGRGGYYPARFSLDKDYLVAGQVDTLSESRLVDRRVAEIQTLIKESV